MKVLIKGGRVLDPASGTDEVLDVLVEDSIVSRIEKDISDIDITENDKLIDAKGCFVCPGLIDMSVHFREPGFEYKETIRTGSRAAARGGFTTVCMMPNTKPAIDNVNLLMHVCQTAKESTDINVLTVAAMTANQEGEYLTDYEALKDNGAIAVSDNGGTIMNSRTARQALRLAAEIDIPVLSHCEDRDLAARGVMNAGEKAKEYGFYGIMNAVEDTIIARNIMLAKNTGAKLHITHCSTEDSVKLIGFAKSLGISCTAEVTPHHFTLTEDVINGEDANYKINPPLRKKADRDALIKGLADGIIDVIASDHAPHNVSEKERGFEEAPAGVVGLETSVSITITELVKKQILSPLSMVEKMSYNPAKILGIDKGVLQVGKTADITVIDPDAKYVIDKEKFVSKGKNTPFDGMEVSGKVILTMVDGKIVYSYINGNEIIVDKA